MNETDEFYNQYFSTAEHLFKLENRKDELEDQIRDCREKLAAIKIDDSDPKVFEFGEIGKVSIKKTPPRFKKEIAQNNFQDIPAEELQMYVGRNIIKPIEEIKINDDYIVGASEDQLNQFIDIGVIKKDIRYKLNLEDPTEDQSELVNTLLEKGVL